MSTKLSGSPVITPVAITPTPSRSPLSLSPHPDVQRRRSNSVQLQNLVESERAETLSTVKANQSSQFNAVDSLSQRLESTTSSALDLFKRTPPTVTAVPLDDDPLVDDETTTSTPILTSSSIVVSPPTDSSLSSTHPALGGATLIKTVELADTGSVVTLPSTSPVSPSVTPSISPSPSPSASTAATNAETVAVLTPLVEAHAEKFQQVDSLSSKLEDTTQSSMDLFKRELPTVIGGRQSSETAPITTNVTTSISTPLTSSGTLGEATLIKTVTIADTAHDRSLSSSSASTSAPVVETFASSSSVSTLKPHTPTLLTDDRDSRSYIGGVEKDTAITAPIHSDKDLEIQSLTLALIQSNAACAELLDRLYASDYASSVIGVDLKPQIPTPSSLLSTVDADDRSLQSFLHDLPVQRGWLRQRTAGTAHVPPAYTRKYCSVSFDGLTLSDNEEGKGARKVDVSKYWLIERTADRQHTLTNYATSSTAPSLLSPMAGKSIFRLEDGAYVLRLVPILTDPAHPHTVVEPSAEQVLEFTGDTEADVTDPTTLTAWVDALNLRISLLSLLTDPAHVHLLARGGREVLTFLCNLTARSLTIENKYVDVGSVLGYFKEGLIHRRGWGLTLRNVGMDDEGARLLAELLMLNHRIHSVDLSYNRITDAGASYLATALEVNQGVVALTLDFNPIGNEGLMEIVGAVAQSTALTSIGLRGLKLHDLAFTGIVSGLKEGVERVWTRVDVSWNELTDGIAKAMGQLIEGFPVSSLNLSHNSVGDKVVSAINGAVTSTGASQSSLTLLDLSYTRVTAAAIPALSVLLSHAEGLSIKLSGNGLSSSSVASLLSTGVEMTVEELRVKKVEGVRPEVGRRMSISREKVGGEVEMIDPLHPTSQKQLGRTVGEMGSLEGTGKRGDELEVPVTAAATEMLVEGGRTADPRA